MDDPVSRVLRLLEKRAITAEEAQRLLGALWRAHPTPGEAPQNSAGGPDPAAAARWVRRALRNAVRAQGRRAMAGLYRFHDVLAGAREAREGAWSPLERVRFVLVHRLFVEPEKAGPSATLREDLGLSGAGHYVLQRALETEFGLPVAQADLAELGTVGDLAAWLEHRMAPAPSGTPTPARPGSPAAPGVRS